MRAMQMQTQTDDDNTTPSDFPMATKIIQIKNTNYKSHRKRANINKTKTGRNKNKIIGVVGIRYLFEKSAKRKLSPVPKQPSEPPQRFQIIPGPYLPAPTRERYSNRPL